MEFSIKNSTFRLQRHKSKYRNTIEIVNFCIIPIILKNMTENFSLKPLVGLSDVASYN